MLESPGALREKRSDPAAGAEGILFYLLEMAWAVIPVTARSESVTAGCERKRITLWICCASRVEIAGYDVKEKIRQLKLTA
jgi:hypothetical protein